MPRGLIMGPVGAWQSDPKKLARRDSCISFTVGHVDNPKGWMETYLRSTGIPGPVDAWTRYRCILGNLLRWTI